VDAATSGTRYGVAGIAEAAGGTKYGVYGEAIGNGTNYGVYGTKLGGSPSYAGYFNGTTHVNGNLTVSGTKPFKIDHPLDPANKYLHHFCPESDEVLNIYTGNVILDADGEAWVEFPEWFAAINRDPRFQLTCIGGFAPVYVAEKISENRFRIAGGSPGLEVSWQVTAVRCDPVAEKLRLPVEQLKSPEERGMYLHPDVYGMPDDLRLHAPPETADFDVVPQSYK